MTSQAQDQLCTASFCPTPILVPQETPLSLCLERLSVPLSCTLSRKHLCLAVSCVFLSHSHSTLSVSLGRVCLYVSCVSLSHSHSNLFENRWSRCLVRLSVPPSFQFLWDKMVSLLCPSLRLLRPTLNLLSLGRIGLDGLCVFPSHSHPNHSRKRWSHSLNCPTVSSYIILSLNLSIPPCLVRLSALLSFYYLLEEYVLMSRVFKA